MKVLKRFATKREWFIVTYMHDIIDKSTVQRKKPGNLQFTADQTELREAERIRHLLPLHAQVCLHFVQRFVDFGAEASIHWEPRRFWSFRSFKLSLPCSFLLTFALHPWSWLQSFSMNLFTYICINTKVTPAVGHMHISNVPQWALWRWGSELWTQESNRTALSWSSTKYVWSPCVESKQREP